MLLGISKLSTVLLICHRSFWNMLHAFLGMPHSGICSPRVRVYILFLWKILVQIMFKKIVFKFEYLILTTKTPGFSFRVYRIWSWWMGASTKCPGTQTGPACHLIPSLSSAVKYLILTPDSCTISPLWPSPRSTIRLAWFSTEIIFQDLIFSKNDTHFHKLFALNGKTARFIEFIW